MRAAISLIVILLTASAGYAQECLDYEPSTVTLLGHIVLQDPPGLPVFGEIPYNDMKKRFIILTLSRPICLNPGNRSNVAEANVQGIQLSLRQNAWAQFQATRGIISTGQEMLVSGTLYHQSNKLQATKILMFVDNLSLAQPNHGVQQDAAPPRR